MAELPQLSRKEWEAAMGLVLSDEVNIDPAERWSSIQAPGNKGNSAGGATTTQEIPDNHPAKGGPRTPEGETDDEIPAGGGFSTRPAKTPETGPISKEIPSAGPASNDSPADKPNKEPNNKFAVKVGKPEPTGKPSGSFAGLQDVNYSADGTSWTAKSPLQPGGKVVTQSGGTPAGVSDGSGPDGSMAPKFKKKIAQDDPAKFPRKGRTDATPTTNADEDLDKDLPDNLALPDGSFFTQNVDDLKNNIDKVQNADQTNPRATSHPWYADIKRHLMNRAADLGASHMIPADWNLSMGMAAERELTHNYSDQQRASMAKAGHALADGSYPIGNLDDLHNAITLARAGHGDVPAAKALIRRRAKALGVQLAGDFK